ncbi:MAG: hypothetical protein HYW07_19570 [Candidatus Latescibacteria bacterium]|nr:hypothetical protein [Candidatus Latescibacterota bacterium]
MPQIGYRQWGLIPADTDPTLGQLYTSRPPMMTALAVDKNTSLVFKLAKTAPQILVQVEVTALSGEKCQLPLLQLFTGPTGEQFRQLETSPWAKIQEGLFLIFTAQFDKPDSFIKLQYTQNHPLVVNRITFSTP